MWHYPITNISFIIQWDNKGLRCMGDAFQEQGGITTRDKLSEDFNINFNFIDYARLIRAIPQQCLMENIEFDREKMNLWCQEHIQIIQPAH